MNYEIVYRNGHVEVYDICGNFLFSADSEGEARRDLQSGGQGVMR